MKIAQIVNDRGLKSRLILIASLIFLLVGLPLYTVAQPEGKWIKLFNGKNLDGWKQLNGTATYEVVDGVLVGTCVPNSPNSFLCTEKEYGDFILELQLKADAGLNSGVQFRSESKPEVQNGRVFGYQMEVDQDPARSYSGGIYDESRRLWLYTLDLNPAAQKAYRWGDWNTYRIECIGNSIRTFVNDVPCSFLMDDMTPKGLIALQVHAISKPEDAGKQVRWRNIRIQTEHLKPAPIKDMRVVNLLGDNQLSEAEKQMGYKMLWDGKSTKGWRGAYKDTFPEKGWRIEDGVLSVEPSMGGEAQNGGDIITTEQFKAFELVFDFQISTGANSGIKYFVTEQYNIGQASAIGLEYQILDDDVHPDAKLGVVGNRTMASLYDLIPSSRPRGVIKRVGEWNQGRLVVYPNHTVQYFLNGYKVLEYERKSAIFRALVARSKYAQWENFGMADQGHILLQDHGDLVRFRNIKIRELIKSPNACE